MFSAAVARPSPSRVTSTVFSRSGSPASWSADTDLVWTGWSAETQWCCSTRAPSATGIGVYAAADAGVVPDDELDAALAVLSPRSVAHGGSAWTRERLEPLPTRLYVARPVELSLLPGVGTDERVPVPLG